MVVWSPSWLCPRVRVIYLPVGLLLSAVGRMGSCSACTTFSSSTVGKPTEAPMQTINSSTAAAVFARSILKLLLNVPVRYHVGTENPSLRATFLYKWRKIITVERWFQRKPELVPSFRGSWIRSIGLNGTDTEEQNKQNKTRKNVKRECFFLT